ncbi:MAG: protein translocase subunit SecD [Sphingomonas sp.]|uniref:protein translocase subunit SecD n=1 Tax=Sphingomonas sp. TaxID=28214 RepID=UPI0025D64BE6|nr:protein translocase subunit SecD [Sphingomonas sp.]MBX3566106.1 protein translocase subunit SecD [Sphingomonas sp.]
MLDFSRAQRLTTFIGLAIMIALAIPSFFPQSAREKWPSWVPKPAINLGLDLAGGSYLLLEGDTSGVAGARLEQMKEQVRTEMRRDPRIEIGDISVQGGKVTFMVRDPSKVDAAREKLLAITGSGVGTTGQREWDIAVVNTSQFVLTPTSVGLNQKLEEAMNDAREIVDKRINALGTLEPTVIREGSSRIVVQVPGLQNPTQLKELLGKTAKLEFKLVDTSVTPEMIAQGQIPPGSQVLPYQEGGGQIAVFRSVIIDGGMLVNATQSFDQQGRPDVAITLDGAGSKRFAKVTQENSGKPFAIIVDNTVISAPNINEPILGGSATISGGFTVDTANQLAIALRSGKLPIQLKVVSENTVSPELGADSIKAGVTASIIAIVAVIVFMILTYGRFGIYSTIAVTINVLIILAVMGMLNATLTLPGIAGFVLTIGTAVDANVLINERIREERRRGRNVTQAIELGYKEASRTIFEANVTHAIAGLIMLILGSGPIRGFAVVLLIGIVSSVFTAVVFTRMLVSIWVRRNRPTDIHI